MPIPADISGMNRLRVSRIINNRAKGQTERQRAQQVWDHILRHEMGYGTTFMRTPDDTLYVYLGVTRELVTLPQRHHAERFNAYLHEMYGITMTETVGRLVFEVFRNHVINYAQVLEPRRFSVYNAQTKTVYLHDYAGGMWRIDGGTPTRITNGEDDVFFLSDDGGVPCEPDIGPHGLLLDTLTDLNFAPTGLSGITPEQQRQALIGWLFALAFPDFMPSKPVLIVEGAPGSGKSAGTQLIQLALTGVTKPIILQRNKESDFGVVLLRSPIAILDNTDTPVDWLADALCGYTTNGQWVARKLFSNQDEVIIKPHAFLAVASKDPRSFRREDVVDRSLIMRLERRDQFTPMEDLMQRIQAIRPLLLGEYIWYVNEIVAHLRTHADVLQRQETTRMADYARFLRAVEAVLRWPTGTVDTMLTAMEAEHQAFINEEDVLDRLLAAWLNVKGPMVGGKPSTPNHGRRITVAQLYTDLSNVSQGLNVTMYKSARTLAQKIRAPHIAKVFVVRSEAVQGQLVYQFWPRSALSLVPDEPSPERPIEIDDEPSLLSQDG